MEYNFAPMNIEYAKKIKNWRYNGFVKSIYMEPYFKNYDKENKKLKGPSNCDGYVVLSYDEIVGLFEYYFTDDILEIGLALNPKLVGKGLGKEFVYQGIKFGIKEFSYKGEYIKLTVNKKNKPAIKVYEKTGFLKYTENEDEIEMRKYV
ncbi:MAG: GNAT family N-acetyltransferase [Firmicutes bacterium]|nr:GNAT family N-acetyltransferase [Bacillota bacterium]